MKSGAQFQAERFVKLIKVLKKKGIKKTLVYWFLEHPSPDSGWEAIIDFLKANNVIVKYGDD